MKPVGEKVRLAEAEVEVLKTWEEKNIFEKTLAKSDRTSPFVFYDGPPFATGLPHYGHLLAGTIKDIIPRYWTMRGRYVERRFGWDCHGLPVEMEIESALGVSGKTEIERYGISNFNDECRKIVLRYTEEWEKTVRRMGRWVDFRNDYRTMDASFMETVWWVFQQMWKRDLVYEGYKVLPFSTRLGTVLSNFEANLNYKDVQDPAITVRFAGLEGENVFFIAWTTTPWTLPSNLALAVGSTIEYVKVRDVAENVSYILAESRLKTYYPKDDAYSVEERFLGKELKGRRYRPLFPYFADREIDGAFRIIESEHVTTEEGTGIVHMAPAYGEEDFYACQQAGVPLVDPVNEEGRFTSEVTDFSGLHVKDADPKIIKMLKAKHLLVNQSTIDHSYPFCWRSETPLIYKAVSTWFVRVESFRDRLVKNNSLTNWVPGHLRDGRFGNWLENARDWAISRNRYWGTPLPIWKNDDGSEVVCLGSVDELAARTGERPGDLHREFVDELCFPDSSGEGTLRRVPQVFDCWFESGSMPYAQVHYPFENRENFTKNFPAHFIAEGLDQTRGWFYTLMVVATALFDKPAFQNVVVNGLVLAEDGKKMSKRLKNYPEPEQILSEHGADALRLYLINSPLVRAEELRFNEQGVRDTVRRLLLPWWNAYRFFVTYALVDEWKPTGVPAGVSPNILDRWILSRKQTLIRRVGEEMEGYRLYNVVPALVDFLNELTNWYVRLNRRRFWTDGREIDKLFAYQTLYDVLVTFSKLMAPFTPFLADSIYLNLMTLQADTALESVHLEHFPLVDDSRVDGVLEDSVDRMQRVILLGRSLRNERKVKVRIPLQVLTIVHRQEPVLSELRPLAGYIQEELNVKEVAYSIEEDERVTLRAKPNAPLLGPRFGKRFGQIRKRLDEITVDQMLAVEAGEALDIDGEVFEPEEIQVIREAREGLQDVRSDRFISIDFPCELNEALIAEGLAREVVHHVQQLRKEAGYNVEDRINVTYEAEGRLVNAIDFHKGYIQRETLATVFESSPPHGEKIGSVQVEGERVKFGVTREKVPKQNS